MAGIYIHIPFCKSRCIYCDFYSTISGRNAMTDYMRALLRELHARRQYIEGTRVHTIYIGGGTPSLIPTALLSDLFDAIAQHFTLAPDAEITVEANPDDVTPQWLEEMAGTPVNRISMGAQTFDNSLLHFLGRRHNARQIADAVRNSHAAGFRNISIDLIYGLPGQTFHGWQHDVESALSLDIRHLSAYALSYENGTKLDMMLRCGQVEETDEELSFRMYRHLCNETERAGFLRYEISNFALPGFHSRHNSSYWQGIPYLGLGAGAHSYDGLATRRANCPDLKAYIAADGDVPHEEEQLTPDERYDEFIMTRLRTSDGIPLDELAEADRTYCLAMAEAHLKTGKLQMQHHKLRLTETGIFTSNDIISDLMK